MSVCTFQTAATGSAARVLVDLCYGGQCKPYRVAHHQISDARIERTSNPCPQHNSACESLLLIRPFSPQGSGLVSANQMDVQSLLTDAGLAHLGVGCASGRHGIQPGVLLGLVVAFSIALLLKVHQLNVCGLLSDVCIVVWDVWVTVHP